MHQSKPERGGKGWTQSYSLRYKTNCWKAYRLHSRFSVGDNETSFKCHSFTESYISRENGPISIQSPSHHQFFSVVHYTNAYISFRNQMEIFIKRTTLLHLCDLLITSFDRKNVFSPSKSVWVTSWFTLVNVTSTLLQENESRETAVQWVEIDRKVFTRKEGKNESL